MISGPLHVFTLNADRPTLKVKQKVLKVLLHLAAEDLEPERLGRKILLMCKLAQELKGEMNGVCAAKEIDLEKERDGQLAIQ